MTLTTAWLRRPTYAVAIVCLVLAALYTQAARASDIESELVVRTEADEALIAALARRFETKHPGTKVVYAAMDSSDILVKTFREMPNPQTDVLTTKTWLVLKGITDSERQFGASMFMPYESREIAGQDPKLVDPKRQWYTERYAARALIVRDDAVKKYGEIKCLNDLLTWKGQFEYAEPIKSGAGFSFVLTAIQDFGGWDSPMGGMKYLADLEKARKMNHPGADTVINMATRGELDAMWNLDIYAYRMTLDRNLLTHAVYPCEGTVVDASSLAIVRNAKHPKAARAWVDFIISQETQEWMTSFAYYQSARTDVRLPDKMKNVQVIGREHARFDVPWDVIAAKSAAYKELWEKHVLK